MQMDSREDGRGGSVWNYLEAERPWPWGAGQCLLPRSHPVLGGLWASLSREPWTLSWWAG